MSVGVQLWNVVVQFWKLLNIRRSLEVKGFVSGQIVIGIMDVSWSIYDVCVDLYKMVYVLNYNGVYMLDYNGI